MRSLIVDLVTAATPMAFLLAQGATPVDPAIVSLIGNGVTVVVLAWYVIYDVRTRTPTMLAAFSREQSELRTLFDKEQAEARTLFAHDQAELRLSCNAIVESIRTTFTQEQNAARAAFLQEAQNARTQYDKQLSELRQMLFDNMNAMRRAVHDVKDTAQTLINRKALNDATQQQPQTGRFTDEQS